MIGEKTFAVYLDSTRDSTPLCQVITVEDLSVKMAMTIEENEIVNLIKKHHDRVWKNVFPLERTKTYVSSVLEERVEIELLRDIDSYVTTCGAKLRMLDLGCGPGTFVVVSQKSGSICFGLEPDILALDIAKKRLMKDCLRNLVICGVGEHLPFRNGTFDVITLFSVLEHVQNIKRVLNECARVLKKDGLLYLTAPNYLRFSESHYKMFWVPKFPKRLAKIYLRLRRRNPAFIDSINYTTPRTLLNTVESLGFKVIYNPIEETLQHANEKIDNPNQITRGGMRSFIKFLKLIGSVVFLRWLIQQGFFMRIKIVARKE